MHDHDNGYQKGDNVVLIDMNGRKNSRKKGSKRNNAPLRDGMYGQVVGLAKSGKYLVSFSNLARSQEIPGVNLRSAQD